MAISSIRFQRSLFKLLPLLVLLSGCANAIRGETQTVSIDTLPSGAHVSLSSGQKCTSPCSYDLPRKNAVMVTASKGRCTGTQMLTPTVETSTFMYSGVFDYAGGGAYTLTPENVKITLRCI